MQLIEGISHHIPIWILEAASKYGTSASFKRAREVARIALGVDENLIGSRTKDMQNGIIKKDLLSVLRKSSQGIIWLDYITN